MDTAPEAETTHQYFLSKVAGANIQIRSKFLPVQWGQVMVVTHRVSYPWDIIAHHGMLWKTCNLPHYLTTNTARPVLPCCSPKK